MSSRLDQAVLGVFGNPPSWKDLRKVYFLCPRPPFGLELSNDISNAELQKLTRHVLFCVCEIVIAIRKDAHPNEPSGSC